MSNTFFIADTHFQHYNIIKYCHRPFKDTVDMDKYMVEKWNSVVKQGDKVFHLGDFALTPRENLAGLRKQLNGSICLIKGNHDRFKYMDYIQAGFNEVSKYPIIVDDLFVLSHKPPEFISADSPMGYVYGHVHDSAMYPNFTHNTACVSAERLDYTPISFEELCAKMENSNI